MCYFLVVLQVLKNHFRIINDEVIRITKQCECKLLHDREMVSRMELLIETHSMLRNVCLIHNSFYSLQINILCMSIVTKIVIFSYFLISQCIMYPKNRNFTGDSPVSLDIYFAITVVEKCYLCFSLLRIVVETKNEVRMY